MGQIVNPISSDNNIQIFENEKGKNKESLNNCQGA